MEFLIIRIKTILIYFKPCSLTVKLQNPFKWDQIKSGTVSSMALAFISEDCLLKCWIDSLGLLHLSTNPSTKNPNMANGFTYSILEWGKDASWRYWSSSLWGIVPVMIWRILLMKGKRISDLGLNKILQVCMDGPSVNLKFDRYVRSNREELKLPKLTDIGSFSLRTTRAAFKARIGSTD